MRDARPKRGELNRRVLSNMTTSRLPEYTESQRFDEYGI